MPQVGLKKMNAMIEVSQIETKTCGRGKELYDRIQHKNGFFPFMISSCIIHTTTTTPPPAAATTTT